MGLVGGQGGLNFPSPVPYQLQSFVVISTLMTTHPFFQSLSDLLLKRIAMK